MEVGLIDVFLIDKRSQPYPVLSFALVYFSSSQVQTKVPNVGHSKYFNEKRFERSMGVQKIILCQNKPISAPWAVPRMMQEPIVLLNLRR